MYVFIYLLLDRFEVHHFQHVILLFYICFEYEHVYKDTML